MNEKDFLERFDKGEEFTRQELEKICWSFEEVDEIDGDCGRWTQNIKTIFVIDERYFAISWERGLTEYQEDEFYEQPCEVEEHTYRKTIAVREWKPIKRCKKCAFYAEFEGVCCNGDSDYRADFVDEDFCCNSFEEGQASNIHE